jgi:hypothetical protein
LPQIVNKKNKLKMKKLFAILAVSAIMTACNNETKTEETPAADTTATMTEAPAAPAADTTAAAPAADTTAAAATK